MAGAGAFMLRTTGTVKNEAQKETKAFGRYTVAVLVPCYNEEVAIAKVVADFKAVLPDADIYVYDNNRAIAQPK
jgi:hypothetical protein